MRATVADALEGAASWTVVRGDCLEVLAEIAANAVDAIVTDPPAGIGFMGREWDSDKGGRDQWITWLESVAREMLRVLKPGGHALVWAIPRTSHWTGMALELAGFEVRDRVSHFFGTGFPKSLNPGREIDMQLCRLPGRHYDKTLPKGDKAQPGDHLCPETPEGDEHRGEGTALKPACEDWWLIRKPLEGTVAGNVQKWGTGGLQIDACRIGGGVDEMRGRSGSGQGNQIYGAGLGNTTGKIWEPNNAGRWPAHVTFDQEAAALLDAQSAPQRHSAGVARKGSSDPRPRDTSGATSYAITGSTATMHRFGDSGGASRFYYVAKPSAAERDAGCEHLPPKSGGEATDREDSSAGVANPRAGAGRGGGRRNHHPTVKSVALMRWLCRLITPPGGVVLDPFTGSGSTGVAALAEGFSFVGIEREAEYLEIAKARLAAGAR